MLDVLSIFEGFSRDVRLTEKEVSKKLGLLSEYVQKIFKNKNSITLRIYCSLGDLFSDDVGVFDLN